MTHVTDHDDDVVFEREGTGLGTILGIIIGYATQKFGRSRAAIGSPQTT